MKIAHIISCCGAGGAEIFVKSLMKSLNMIPEVSSIELWVMSNMYDISPNDTQKLQFEKDFVNEVENNGISVKFINKKPKKNWFKTKKELRKKYNSFNPDIVHTHLEAVTFHTCRALSKYNVPIIQTIHSTVIDYPLIQRYFINKKTNGYVAISKKIRENIYNEIGVKHKRIYLIYNGIQIEKFEVSNRNVDRLVNNIIAIGRLTKAKDHKTLLSAMKILIDKLNIRGIKIPNLLIVGEGELEREIRELAVYLGVDSHVKFLGIRQDIPELLSRSDIYVMSSEWEGLSISLIEALASGIPIVVTDAGSNNEIIESGKNGLIVPIRDPQALAEGLYDVITNSYMRYQFTNNARSKAKQFEIEECALKHLDMYNKVLRVSKDK